MLKKIFLGIMILAVIAFGGLAFYVSTIDWNKYKIDIAQKFSELTGKEIEINGSVNVSLLPHPILKAHDVSVYNRGDEKNTLATIKKINMSVSLLSILNGTPDINSLALADAEIWLRQNEKGKLNWSLSNAAKSLDSGKTNLQNLNLQNATFHYENESADIKFDIKKINAEIQAEAVGGPYRMDGNFIKDNDHFAIAVGVGSLNSLDGIETNFSISHPASESYFRFDGVYNPQDHNIKGDFSGGSRKTAQFVNAISAMHLLDDESQQELQFSSGVEADVSLLKLSSFVIKYGQDIEGSGSLTYPLAVAENKRREIDLKYEFLNFDIRPFIPALKAKYKQYKDDGGVYLPDTHFDITAELAAKHVDIGEGEQAYLENVSMKAEWKDNNLSIDEFYANGVGDTAISISGDLREENARPKYFIKTSVISTDFLSFANSFGAKLKSHVQSSYRNAKFDFSIVGDDGGFQMENAEFSIDKMKINVDFSTLFMLGNHNFKIKAITDNFNFDNYLQNDEENRKFVEQLQEDLKVLSSYKKWNVDIDFAAESAVFRRTPISSLTLKAKSENGVLAIEDFSAKKVAGADVKIFGQLDFNQDPLSLQDITININAENISDLISQINLDVPSWKLFRTKTFKLTSNLSGSMAEFFTNIAMDIDGTSIIYGGNIKSDIKETMNGSLSVKTLNLGQFFEKINVDASNFPNKNSALSCEGMVEFNNENFNYTDFKCLVGASNYDGKLSIKKQENDKNIIEAELTADEFNLSYIFDLTPSKTTGFSTETSFDNTLISRPDLSRDTLNFSGYDNREITLSVSTQKGILKRMVFENLSFKMTNKDKVLKIEELNADYKNAHYTGELSFSYNNPENPALTGHIEFNDFDIGLIGGSIYMFNNGKITGKADFESRGNSAYELFTNMSGDISMNITDLNFKGFNFAAIQRDIAARKYSKGLFQTIRDNLQKGETQFEPFDITINLKNGLLSVSNLNVTSDSAKADINFDIDLKDWKINSKAVISLLKVFNIPSFEASLNGMLQKPSLEINIENIVKHYDEYWKKVEKEENEQKELLKQKLNSKMTYAQKKLSELSLKVNKYVPILEEYKQNSPKEENVAWYDSKLNEIGLINKNIDEMKAKAHTPDFTEDDIVSIKKSTQTYKKDISLWDDEIDKRRNDDIDFAADQITTQKDEINAGSEKMNTDYESKFDEQKNILAKIKKDQMLTDDEDLKKAFAQFDSTRLEMAKQIIDIEKKIAIIKSTDSKNKKDNFLLESKDMMEKLSATFIKAQAYQTELLKQLDDTVQRLTAKPEKKSAKKNSEDGSNVDISRSVDISNENEQDGILRNVSENSSSDGLSQDTSAAKGIIIKSYDANTKPIAPQPKKKGLLRTVDGAVKKASGTIIVK